MPRILLIDDEAHVRRVLSLILREDGHEISEARNVAEGRAAIRSREYDVILTDQKMPDGEGLALLAATRELDPPTPVILITAYATVELAVSAMRQGAFDVLSKPFEPDAVRLSVGRACERMELLRENESLKGAVRRLDPTVDLVGRSAPMLRLLEMIARLAPTASTVLITGETGSGKELVARSIHAASPRAEHPFVAVNCAALSEHLLESELFGHEKGAFTGADRTRQGVFEAAHGGTLFLDEAAEMTPPLQAKLLRVLMEGEVVRVGSTTVRKVDVRILSATNRDLKERVREGLFREDLYYRLAVIPVSVPPLRERKEDLPLLTSHILARLAQDLKIPPRRITPEALALLGDYEFPGNVRELRNLLERASILCRGEAIAPEDLPIAVSRTFSASRSAEEDRAQGTGDRTLKKEIESFERSLLLRALEAAAGNQAEAARRLGVSRSDMSYKVRKYRLEDDTRR